jgi:rhodanese-related sulfurtransferase
MNLYDNPKIQDFNLEGVKHISVNEVYELIVKDEVFIIDVREKEEHEKEFFEFQNVFFYPMSSIMDTILFIPKEIPLVVVCNEGVRSTKVANLLKRQGFAVVANMDGGIYEWKAKELPITPVNMTNMNSNTCSTGGCGCGCDSCE